MSNDYKALGKFQTARDEILHILCSSDWAEDEFGSSVDWHLYAWKVEITVADLGTPEVQEAIAEAFENLPNDYNSTDLLGTWLVVENSVGAVSSAEFTLQEWTTYNDAWDTYNNEDEEA